MASKQDTPAKTKTSSNRLGIPNKLSTNTSNEDVMSVLISFKNEILTSNKKISDSQYTQFKDLNNNLKHVSSLITELKASNSKLREELEALKKKWSVLRIELHRYNQNKLFLKSYIIHLSANDAQQT